MIGDAEEVPSGSGPEGRVGGSPPLARLPRRRTRRPRGHASRPRGRTRPSRRPELRRVPRRRARVPVLRPRPGPAQSRGVSFDSGQLARLQSGVDAAAAKGSREALVLVDGVAMVVAVRNRTVVTALPARRRRSRRVHQHRLGRHHLTRPNPTGWTATALPSGRRRCPPEARAPRRRTTHMLRSMFTAIGGLRNHQVMLDVTANNIANVNTVGYKAQRVDLRVHDGPDHARRRARPCRAASAAPARPRSASAWRSTRSGRS